MLSVQVTTTKAMGNHIALGHRSMAKHMRGRADWMMFVDDPILEIVRDLRASSPAEVAEEVDYSREHVNRRMQKLYEYQLLERPSRGLYRITDNAEAYLDENLDANKLEKRE
mgnify:CR=1 FL=1